LFTCGGDITSGRRCTCGVLGVNCSSSNIWSRNTTCPGEVATFSPTLNGVASTWLGIRLLWRTSCTRCCSPFTRLAPPVSRILRTAVGVAEHEGG